jgi:transposase
MGMPPVSAEEIAVLEHDYRYADSPLVRQRSHIVLLAYQLETQDEVAKVVRRSRLTVWRTLQLYREGGRTSLRRKPLYKAPRAKTNLAWQKELAEAMKLGPQACGVPRPTWTAHLLAKFLEEKTGIAVGEHTVRRGLELLGYVCRRPTWTVRHKAEEEPDYHPKKKGSKRS